MYLAEADSYIWIVAIVAATLVPIIVIVTMLGKKKRPDSGEALKEAQPVTPEPPPAVDAGAYVPASTATAPVTAPSPQSTPQPAPDIARGTSGKPPTLEVEALSPSNTGEAPMLGAEPDELRLGTDELPRMSSGEMPVLAEVAPAVYRTQPAKDLAAAIETGDCPKCKAPTFVGSEEAEEIGADGVAMFKLTGRCGACGHRAELIDMKA